MTAAAPLPDENPWRDTTKLQTIPSAADLAACPPADPAAHESHDKALQASLRAAEPFGIVDSYYDALDEAQMIFEAGAEADQCPACKKLGHALITRTEERYIETGKGLTKQEAAALRKLSVPDATNKQRPRTKEDQVA